MKYKYKKYIYITNDATNRSDALHLAVINEDFRKVRGEYLIYD